MSNKTIIRRAKCVSLKLTPDDLPQTSADIKIESLDDRWVAMASMALNRLSQLQLSRPQTRKVRNRIQGFKDGLRAFEFACANKPDLALKAKHILRSISRILSVRARRDAQ